MAKPAVPQAYSHFSNVTVRLYPELDRQARAEWIAADLADGRRRLQHPAALVADLAFAATPAPLLRWGVSLFIPTTDPRRSPATPWCRVSTGTRRLAFRYCTGAADRRQSGAVPGDGSHAWRAHGIGDTVAISVHAAESAVGDIDDDVARLDAEL